jgi:hypothetical protein
MKFDRENSNSRANFSNVLFYRRFVHSTWPGICYFERCFYKAPEKCGHGSHSTQDTRSARVKSMDLLSRRAAAPSRCHARTPQDLPGTTLANPVRVDGCPRFLNRVERPQQGSRTAAFINNRKERS